MWNVRGLLVSLVAIILTACSASEHIFSMKVIFAVVIACLAENITPSPVSLPKSNANARLLDNNDAKGNPILFGEAEAASPLSARGKSLMKTPPGGQSSRVSLVFPGSKQSSGTNRQDGVGPDGVVFSSASTRGNTPKEVPSESNCSLQGGSMVINGTCHSFLTLGPCAEGQWLVLRDNRPLCEPRPCPFGQLKYKEKCVSVSDFSVCKDGQILYVEFSGVAMCDCEPNYIYDVYSGKCFAPQVRGSCNFGEYFQLSASGAPECVPNECVMDGYVKDDVTRKCYRKMYLGYCNKDRMTFYPETNTVDCSFEVDTRNILDVHTLRACPAGSLRDYLNECRQQFIIPTTRSSPSVNGACPAGFVKDPKGICRRVSTLFG